MTKQDLRSGMICKHRDGDFSMILLKGYETGNSEDNLIFASNSRAGLDAFDNNFKWIPYKNPIEDNDIIAIYSPGNVCKGFQIFEKHHSQIDITNWKLLWSEPIQAEEMTLAEVCKALGKNIKIVK